MKKKENLKVVSINEKLIGNMNKEIVSALTISQLSSNKEDFRFNDLIPQIELRMNGDNDINYISKNGYSYEVDDYVLDRREMLYTSYNNFVNEKIQFISNCILISLKMELPYTHIYIDDISKIISKVFNTDLRCFMFNDNTTENITDLRVINNQIPTVCLELETFLRKHLLQFHDIRDLEDKIKVTDEYGDFTKLPDLDPKVYFTNYGRLEDIISSVIRSTNLALVTAYCEIKEYVNLCLCPLGYPEHKFDSVDDNDDGNELKVIHF